MLHTLRHDDMRVDRVLKERYLAELSSALSAVKNIYEADTYLSSVREEFSRFFQYRNVNFTGSGTESLSFILWLISRNAPHGAQIIIPAVEYASILSSFSLFPNLEVKICDVDAGTLTLTADTISEHISDDTYAVLAAHMFGNPAPLADVRKLGKKHGLLIIEDVCQAIGNRAGNSFLGTLGDFSFFSFSHSKMLSSFGKGQGGAYAIRLKRYAEYENEALQKKALKGISAISLLEAAGLRVKLQEFPGILKYHEERKKEYCEALQGMGSVQVVNSPQPHQGMGTKMVVLFQSQRTRDRIYASLKSKGILSELPYTPLPVLLNRKEQFPHAESYHSRGLHLPFFALIKPEEIEFIVKSVRQALSSSP